MAGRTISIKTKMAAAISALVAGVVLAMGLIAASYFHHELECVIIQQQAAIVANVAKDIDDKFSTAQNALAAVAGITSPDTFADPVKAQIFLNARAGTKSMFDHGLVLFDGNGALVAETQAYTGDRAEELLGQFRKTMATRKPVISDPHKNSVPHDTVEIYFTVPVIDAQGKAIGVLAGILDLLTDNILGGASRIKFGKTGSITLFNSDRTMIIHPDRKIMLNRKIPAVFAGLYDGDKPAEGSKETVSGSGARVLASYKRLSSINWIVAGNYPIAEAYAPLKRLQFMTAGFSLLVCGLSILFIWIFMGKCSGPLMHFIRHVEQMPSLQGEEKFYTAETGGEIAILAEAFNTMIRKLDDQQEKLQKNMVLYELLACHSSDMAIWLTPDRVMRYISPQCLQVTGYEAEEFYKDRQLLDWIIHPDDLPLWQKHKGHLNNELQEEPMMFRIVKKTGEICWVSHQCRLVFNDAAEFIGIHGSLRDITHLRKREEQVGEAKAFAEKIIELTAIPMYVIDAGHHVIFWNRACAELTGVKAEEMVGTDNHWQPFFAEKRDLVSDMVIEGKADNADASFAASSCNRFNGGLQLAGWNCFLNGRARSLTVSAIPVRNGGGRIIAAIETIHDLTGTQEAETEVKNTSNGKFGALNG